MAPIHNIKDEKKGVRGISSEKPTFTKSVERKPVTPQAIQTVKPVPTRTVPVKPIAEAPRSKTPEGLRRVLTTFNFDGPKSMIQI